MEEVTISVLVPPDNPSLSEALRGKIQEERIAEKIVFKKSPDKFCHVQVGGGVRESKIWWAINKLVLQVERRHRMGKSQGATG